MSRQITRRRLLAAAGAALMSPFPTAADTPRLKRIVWDAVPQGNHDRLRSLFAARGLVDGRNCTLEFTERPRGRPPQDVVAHLDRLVASRPDVLVVAGNDAMLLRRTRGVPIVFRNLAKDPAKLGLVESLRRPGGNMTGSTLDDDEMTFFMWQLLKEVAPGMKRGGFLQDKEAIRQGEQFFETHDRSVWQALYKDHVESMRVLEARLGIQIVEVRMRLDASTEEITAMVRKAEVQALQVVIIPPTDAVIEALKATRVPAVGIGSAGAKRGLLMGITWDGSEGVRYAVEAVERILKGQSPATIPVSRVRTWEFAINKATARAIGIEIPQSIMIRAKEVFE